MAEIIGPQTILTKALPTGVDGTRLAQWALRSGRTWEQVINDLALAIAEFNTRIFNKWGWLISITEEMMLEYPDGGSVTALKEISDVDLVDVISGTTIGHMIDLRAYGGGIGGSKRYWRDAREAQVLAQMRAIIARAEWRFEQKLLARWLTDTENAVGSAGYDVPFVRGTGGSVDFTPPAYDGTTFASSHTHYIGLASASKGFDDVIEEGAATLYEHGHMAPYDLVASKTDIDAGSYGALSNWVQLITPNVAYIDRGGATSGNQMYAMGRPGEDMGIVGYYQSAHGEVRVRATGRIATGYAGIAKSYGVNDVRNPLAVRVHPDVGFGAYVVPELTDDTQYPLKQANIEFEFGVSVGQDRTAGAAMYLVSGGAWANPTIS